MTRMSFFTIAIFFIMQFILHAQTEDTRFEVFVRQANGTGLSGATVKIVHMATNDTTTLGEVPSRAGWYRYDNVPFGKYKILVNGAVITTDRFHATNRLYDTIVQIDPDGNLQIDNQGYEDGSITAGKIAGGNVVKSLNSLNDNVVLKAGTNVSIASNGADTLTISAAGGAGGGGGTITAVYAGTGLSGGGILGDVTLYIGAEQITGTMIADEAIDTRMIAPSAVGTTQISSITSADIPAGTIVESDLANGAVTNSKMADASVGTSKLQVNSVNSTIIIDGSIANADLGSQVVTNPKIAPNSIDSTQIDGRQVGSSELDDKAVIDRAMGDGVAVRAINTLQDTLTLAAGTGINITSNSVDTLTVANTGVTGVNSLTGGVRIVAGSNVTVDTAGDSVTISSTGGGGGGDVTTAQLADTSTALRAEYDPTKLKVNGNVDSTGFDLLGSFQTTKDMAYGKGFRSYLMFTFDNNAETLRILKSDNLRDWKWLSNTGYGGGELRDPAAMEYNGEIYVVYTGGNFGSVEYFVVAKSSDLTNWAPVDTVYMSYLQGIQRTWSPRWFIHPTEHTIHVIVGIRRFASTDFQMYEVHPLNSGLTEWSDPRLISGQFPEAWQDGQIFYYANKYYLFYNNYESSETGRISYSYSDNPFDSYVMGDSARWGVGYEGANLLVKQDTVFAFFDDLISSGTGGVHYTWSIDTFQTWATPTTITDNTPTVNRNARILELTTNAVNFANYKANKDIPAKINIGDISDGEGRAKIYHGFPNKPDTLAVYNWGGWSKIPSENVNQAQSFWNPNNPNCVLHFTFNGEVQESKGHTFKLYGPFDKYTAGPRPGLGAINLADTSYIEILHANAADLNFSTNSFTICAIFKNNQNDYNYFVTKRNGTLGWHTSLNLSDNKQEFYLNDGSASETEFGGYADTLRWHLGVWQRDSETANDTVRFWLDYNYRYQRLNNANGDLSNTGNVYVARNGSIYFLGELAELVVYDSLRSPDSLLSDYNRFRNWSAQKVSPLSVSPFTKFFYGDSIVFQTLFENSIADEKGHSTIEGATFTYATGYLSQSTAAYFDGSTDYLQVNDTTTLDFDSSFTVAMMVKLDEVGSPAINHQIVNKRVGTDGYQIAIHTTDDEVEVFYGDGTTSKQSRPGVYDLVGGTWYMVHVVYDEANKRYLVYVNGQYKGTDFFDNVSGTAASTAAFLIGKFSTIYFKGWMDEVAIWNYPLSSGQIKTMWNRAVSFQ